MGPWFLSLSLPLTTPCSRTIREVSVITSLLVKCYCSIKRSSLLEFEDLCYKMAYFFQVGVFKIACYTRRRSAHYIKWWCASECRYSGIYECLLLLPCYARLWINRNMCRMYTYCRLVHIFLLAILLKCFSSCTYSRYIQDIFSKI